MDNLTVSVPARVSYQWLEACPFTKLSKEPRMPEAQPPPSALRTEIHSTYSFVLFSSQNACDFARL